jgi:hypothetical protein
MVADRKYRRIEMNNTNPTEQEEIDAVDETPDCLMRDVMRQLHAEGQIEPVRDSDGNIITREARDGTMQVVWKMARTHLH